MFLDLDGDGSCGGGFGGAAADAMARRCVLATSPLPSLDVPALAWHGGDGRLLSALTLARALPSARDGEQPTPAKLLQRGAATGTSASASSAAAMMAAACLLVDYADGSAAAAKPKRFVMLGGVFSDAADTAAATAATAAAAAAAPLAAAEAAAAGDAAAASAQVRAALCECDAAGLDARATLTNRGALAVQGHVFFLVECHHPAVAATAEAAAAACRTELLATLPTPFELPEESKALVASRLVAPLAAGCSLRAVAALLQIGPVLHCISLLRRKLPAQPPVGACRSAACGAAAWDLHLTAGAGVPSADAHMPPLQAGAPSELSPPPPRPLDIMLPITVYGSAWLA